MFGPSDAIAKLDSALLKTGQDVTLAQLAPAATKAVRAFVRGYRPEELTGTIRQGDSEVVVSPTGLLGSVFATDPAETIEKVEIDGRRRNVEGVEPVFVAGVMVRINLLVRG